MRTGSGTRATFRRFASVMAAVGALLVSSGITLMATSTTATADPPRVHKSYVCKYVGKPGDGTEILQSGQNPIWVDNHSLDPQQDVVAKGDVFTDAQGYSVVIIANTPRLDPEPGIEACGGSEPNDQLAHVVVTFTDPTCENDNEVGYSTEGSTHVTFTLQGTVGFGEDVTVKAKADPGYKLDSNGKKVDFFPHTFGTEQTNCEVSGPVTPEPPTFVQPTCTTGPAIELADGTALPLGTTTVDPVSYLVTGDLVAGGTVHVTASPVSPAVFAEGVPTTWDGTFVVPTGCTNVSPPKNPTHQPKTQPTTETTTPTVVHAGLAGDPTSSTRGDGLALVAAGLVLLASAGGLRLAEGGKRR
jgi:hypothetical protein